MSDDMGTAYDVVVVGAGGAGLMAAVAAAERGARVLVLEKNQAVGGKTGISMGLLTAAATPHQRAIGIADTSEAHLVDWERMAIAAGHPEPDLALMRVVAETGASVVERLSALGVVFDGPHPEGLHRVYRMHAAVDGPEAYVTALRGRARDLRCDVWTGATAAALLREPGGRVVGVVVRRGDGADTDAAGAALAEELARESLSIVPTVPLGAAVGALVRVVARRGVILAAGDYTASPTLMTTFAPGVPAYGSIVPWATGDGHELARAAGAALVPSPRSPTQQLRFVRPPHTEPSPALYGVGAIAVNARGERFADERDAKALTAAAADQPGGTAYMLLDGATAAHLATTADDQQPSRDGWLRTGKLAISTFTWTGYGYLADYLARTPNAVEAPSREALARQLGFDAEALERLGAAPVRGETRPPLATPPYYALGPLRAFTLVGDASVRVDTRFRALDAAGRPIAGLYAAGSNGQGAAFTSGHGHHLLWAFASGGIAGESAAEAS